MGLFDGFRKTKTESVSVSQPLKPETDQRDRNLPISQADANAVDDYGEVVGSVESDDARDDRLGGTDESASTKVTSGIFVPQEIRAYEDKKPVDHVPRDTRVMAIINQKGGVGKSTTAINLSAALGELGKQVLLVDFDPQGNTTSGFGVEKSQLSRCVYNMLLDDVPIIDVIIPDVCEGVDLVPATINLAGAEVELVSEMARENRLKEALDTMRGAYDYIFIDCPPSLGLLTVNALVASDKLIIPIQTEFYALEGVTKLLESMKRVKSRLNTNLDIFGILLTMYDGRTTLSRQVAAEVRNYFGDRVFETIVPRTVKLSEAPSYGIPITHYDPLGKGAMAYRSLAKEVIERG